MFILAHCAESDAGRCEKWKINSTLARNFRFFLHIGIPFPGRREVWLFLASPFRCVERCWIEPKDLWKGKFGRQEWLEDGSALNKGTLAMAAWSVSTQPWSAAMQIVACRVLGLLELHMY